MGQTNNSLASVLDVKITIAERLIKAKIKTQRERPFWGYLLEYVRFIKTEQVPTMGVDKYGRCFYNEKFVAKLSEAELQGVLAHEIQHVSLRHISRGEGREVLVNDQSLWNIAIDLVDNHILIENGFTLPSSGLIPSEGSYNIFGIQLDGIDIKAAEDLYEEILAQLKRNGSEEGDGSEGDGDGRGKSCVFKAKKGNDKGFDQHLSPEEGDSLAGESGEDGESGEGKGKEQLPTDWNKVVVEAYHYAKQIGKTPAGMERIFGDLHKAKINWRAYIRNDVAHTIPSDYSYARPRKSLIGLDIFLPSTKREKTSILVSIDTSGSIGQSELTDFMSEIIGMSKAFANTEFRVLCHDTEVALDLLIRDSNEKKLKAIVPKGGGGTSHTQLLEYIKEHRYTKDAKLLISFTDGYSVYPDERPPYPVLFVLAGGHTPKENMPKWGKVVCLA